MGMQRVKQVQRNRKEMIYSKSFAGIGLHLHPVSPTALSLSLAALFISLWEIAEWALLRVFAVIDSKCKLSL